MARLAYSLDPQALYALPYCQQLDEGIDFLKRLFQWLIANLRLRWTQKEVPMQLEACSLV